MIQIKRHWFIPYIETFKARAFYGNWEYPKQAAVRASKAIRAEISTQPNYLKNLFCVHMYVQSKKNIKKPKKVN